MPAKVPNNKRNEETKQKRVPLKPDIKKLASRSANVLNHSGADSEGLSSSDVLALQREAGNEAVTQLLSSTPTSLPIQTKLKVGPTNDLYEHEADRMADKVMGISSSTESKQVARDASPSIQRQTPEEEELLQMKPLVQRQELDEEEELLQMKPLAQRVGEEIQAAKSYQLGPQDSRKGFETGNSIEGKIKTLRGGGKPLPEKVRTFMEPRFKTDFSGVRIHTGKDAAKLNLSLRARAFTHGKDIYMGDGSYNPGSETGKRLLAHELTHVVQQGGAKNIQPKPGVQRQELEEEELLQMKPLVGHQEIPNVHEQPPDY
jgi:hypothetical protein